MLAAVLLNGCVMNWQAQSAPPAQVIESSGESEIRVTLNAGNSLVSAIRGSKRTAWSAGSSPPVIPAR